MRLEDERGYSLIELMAVISILAILIVAAVASYVLTSDRAKATACRANLRVIRQVLVGYHTTHARYPEDMNSLVSDGLLRARTDIECPKTRDIYSYNQETGDVKCLTQGHEDF
ncbi:MAG: type II secretion system GspH family protein [Actinobacteria bacterium]|nr:type II secretion system GspH family protein [Actinomycetota bacterium]